MLPPLFIIDHTHSQVIRRFDWDNDGVVLEVDWLNAILRLLLERTSDHSLPPKYPEELSISSESRIRDLFVRRDREGLQELDFKAACALFPPWLAMIATPFIYNALLRPINAPF